MNRILAAAAPDPRQLDPQQVRSRWAMGRGDAERAFAKAKRHSRHVRVMRIGIPIGVMLVMVLVVVATWFNPLRLLANSLPIDMNNLVVSGTKITMEAPRLSGFTRDQRAYDLVARAAAQDLTKPDLVELTDIKAHVEMQDKSKIELLARDGVYNAKAETMTLGQNVVLTSSSGYQARLTDAQVDIRKGNVLSEQPVEVEMMNGRINANRLEVVEGGALVRFDGGVVMNITRLQSADAPAQAKP